MLAATGHIRPRARAGSRGGRFAARGTCPLFDLPEPARRSPLAAPAAAKKRCPDARYVVEGTLLPGETALRFDAIDFSGRKVSIDSGCPQARAHLERTRRGTRVRVRWPACGGYRKVRLRGLIARDCSSLDASLLWAGAQPQPIAGVPEPKPSVPLWDGQPHLTPEACSTSFAVDALEKFVTFRKASGWRRTFCLLPIHEPALSGATPSRRCRAARMVRAAAGTMITPSAGGGSAPARRADLRGRVSLTAPDPQVRQRSASST
jgi:hypothetical protein